MTVKSPVFAAARISVLENKLISRDNLNNIAHIGYDELIKILHDINYGGANGQSDDIDELISGEIDNLRKLISELSCDEQLTDLFFFKNDITNLKHLIKLKLQGKEPDYNLLDKNGLYDTKLLALMVKEWEFPDFPEIVKHELSLLDEKLAVSKNPQTVSVYLDRAYYKYVRSFNRKEIDAYFGTECDFINLLTVLRMLKYDVSADELEQLFMPEYNISYSALKKCYMEKSLSASKLLDNVPFNVSKYMRNPIDNSDVIALQKAKDDCLIAIARENKAQMDTIYPVIWFYVAKTREAEIIRLAATLKRSGISDNIIEERLRELYG